MSTKHPMAALLSELLGGQYTELTVRPGQDIGEAIEEAIEMARAEHMKTCESCRAEHEAELKKKAQEEMTKPAEAGQSADTRAPVGYVVMLTHPGREPRALHNSFGPDYKDVMGKLETFKKLPMMNVMFGMSGVTATVEPLYL